MVWIEAYLIVGLSLYMASCLIVVYPIRWEKMVWEIGAVLLWPLALVAGIVDAALKKKRVCR